MALNYKGLMMVNEYATFESSALIDFMCDLVIQVLWFFVTALLQVATNSYTKFQVNILNTFEDTLQTNNYHENTEGEIIQNVRQTELWFLVPALLQATIYLYIKF